MGSHDRYCTRDLDTHDVNFQSPSSAEISYTVFQLDHPLLHLSKRRKKKHFPHDAYSRITAHRSEKEICG